MNCSIENFQNPHGYNTIIPKGHSTDTHTLLSVENGDLNGYCQGKQLVSPENMSDLNKCQSECLTNCQNFCPKSKGGHLNSASDCTPNCSDFCLDHHEGPSTGNNGAAAAESCSSLTSSQGCGDIQGCCQSQCKGDFNCVSGCMNKLANCCAFPGCNFSNYCKNCNPPSGGGGRPSPGGGGGRPSPGGGGKPKPPPGGGGGDGPTQQDEGFFNTTGGKITLWTGIGILALLAIIAIITTIMKHRKKA